jgi:hypothetical protein
MGTFYTTSASSAATRECGLVTRGFQLFQRLLLLLHSRSKRHAEVDLGHLRMSQTDSRSRLKAAHGWRADGVRAAIGGGSRALAGLTGCPSPPGLGRAQTSANQHRGRRRGLSLAHVVPPQHFYSWAGAITTMRHPLNPVVSTWPFMV